ncbi:HTTM domain-containing protein [Streptomyces sp. NBC_01426]|uniref:HTTM domain-containing protein n=1 Tax=Streptomyces sp. NBC_01426 TaxID=2975866 RepID=UPI002E357048|nr:HTTM domain-containing protein [Streptomyces sp. NBC_01426]
MGNDHVVPQSPPAPDPSRDSTCRKSPGTVQRLVTLVTERPVSLYAVSVLRAGYGLLYLLFLLREFPHRHEIWGPSSPWTPALAQQLFDQTGWSSVLALSDSRAYFELCYVLALLASTLFMLGWRTRAVSVLFAVVVTSFHARSIFMTDGGDNLILLMAVYLAFTACGRRWSLDARRKRLKAARADGADGRPKPLFLLQLGEVRSTAATVVHNCALFVMAAEVCFLYGSAGLYKVQGGSWGNGTALHYVLNLELFQPWPALSHFADEHTILIAIATYTTVLLQVAFPFVLFGRLKYPVLVLLLGMHIGIAVIMGLPLFSGAMIVADAVFLPDRFYSSLPGLCRGAAERTGRWRPAAAERAASTSTVPSQGRHPDATGPRQQTVPEGREAPVPTTEVTPSRG